MELLNINSVITLDLIFFSNIEVEKDLRSNISLTLKINSKT